MFELRHGLSDLGQNLYKDILLGLESKRGISAVKRGRKEDSKEMLFQMVDSILRCLRDRAGALHGAVKYLLKHSTM